MSGVVEIRLLGPRLFAAGGEPVRFVAPPRTIPLLGYLVITPGTIPREQIAAALWPDVDDEEARTNLRRHLYHLQQALPESETPWLETGPDGLRWSGAARIDVVEFERAHAAGDHASAAAWYGGEFLEGHYDDWIITQRERLASAYLDDLQALLAHARSQRDFSSATAYAQRILQLDEWREDAVRALMAVRYESGDRAGALGTFERFARKLSDEMHVEPMTETRALRDAILRNAPVSVAAQDGRHTRAGSLAPPFVGRSDELSRLSSLWDAVGRRSGGVAFVSGEAGIGKTRLVHEFALQVERQGGRVLIGSTTQHEPAPYEALAEALRSAAVYLSEAQIDPLWLRVLANVVPDLHTEPGAPEAIGESQERTRLFEAMRRALTALGKTRPFLVVLEDLHWAGGESIDALEYIARHFAGICGVILATYRDDEQPQCSHLERVRRTLERDRRAIHVQPSRLTQDGVAQLVEQMFSDDAGAPALAQSLHRMSDGNPLFVMQLLRDFNETGQLPDATQPSADMAEILASRIARLSENSRILAEHAAVAGRTFSIDVLRDATGWSEDQVLAALSELIDRHFMRASSESARYQYTFSHNLVQLAIYAQMPPRNRERIHHRMAVICERAEAENAALAGETAQHWDAAGESQRAAAAYVRAADRAFAVYANETARAHARRAIELGASGELRYRALRQLVAADERIGDKEAWAKDVDALLHAAEQAGPDERFEALACAARRFGSIGDRHAQREMLDRMKSVATASGKPEQLARTLIDEGALLWRRGDVQNAQRGIREALAAARSAGDAKLELQARLALVHAMMYGGEVDEARAEIAAIESELGTECSAHDRMDLTRAKANAAIVREDGPSLEQYARELGELARRVGSLEAEAESERFLAYVAVYRYNLEQTRERMLSAAEKFDRAGSHQLYCSVLVDVAATNVELGNYDEAEQQLGEVLPLTQQLEWPGGTAIATLNRAEIRRLRNQLSEACELAAQGLKHALNMQDPRIQSTALCLLGSIECEMGRHDRGLAHLREGIALRRTTKADWSLAGDLCLLIDSLLIAGDVAAAREAADELQRIYDAEPKRQMSPAKICWTLALVRRACGDQAGFRSLVERGRSILEERRSAFKDPRIRDAFLSRRFCRELLAEGGTA